MRTSSMPTPATLASAVAVALAGWSIQAEAAGLGRLSVQSALGQPLRAEVEVTSVGPDEATTLTARLASPEAFRAAGLQFNNALAGLSMAVEERGGRHVIRVSSSNPINEPFVDLMVELNWSSGKFVREYTFLLDPPELRASRQTVESGGPGVAPAASALATPSVPAPVRAAPTPAAPAPAASSPSVAQSAAPAASVPSPARSSAAAARGAAATTPAASADQPTSVTVGRGDTLGKIAAGARPANATLEQTIIAIYQANRSAFIENNPNLIRQGRTLSIPDAASIAAVDPSTAQRQLRVASQDFRAYKERIAGAAAQVPVSTAGTTASGTVTGRVEDRAAQSTSPDRLELSRSTMAGGERQAGSVGSRDAEAQVARDAAVTEASSRVAELERTVADLQRMLELRSRAMSDLQAQLDKARTTGAAVSGAVGQVAGAASPSSSAPSPAASQPAASQPTTPPSTAAAPASPSSSSEPASSSAGTPAEPASPSASSPSPAAEPATTASGSAEPAAPAMPTPPLAQTPAPVAQAPAPEAEPSFFDGLLDNPITLPAIGGLGLLAILGGWMVMRRRRKVEKFEDSLVAADAFTANSLFGTTGGQNVDTTTAATATQVSTMSETSPTEVDPIAEADVYIAYGREAQAEEILKEALKRQPERQAIRLKLMEIYAGRKDAQAFESVAREMHAATGGQNEEWPKVAAMGLAIDPANALYTGGQPSEAAPQSSFSQAAAVASAAAASAAAAEASRGPVTLSGAVPAFEDSRLRQGPATTPDLDFNLDLDSTGDVRGAPAKPSPTLSDFEPAMGFQHSAAGPLSAMPNVDLPSLDLDVPPVQPAKPVPVAVRRELEVDVGALETLTGPSTASGAQTQVGPDLDLSAIGLDLSPTTISGPATMTGAGSSQWQEMASKLDLASAYGEIGDKEGARELLQEVVRGGDPAQQQRAREMLASI